MFLNRELALFLVATMTLSAVGYVEAGCSVSPGLEGCNGYVIIHVLNNAEQHIGAQALKSYYTDEVVRGLLLECLGEGQSSHQSQPFNTVAS